MPDIIIRPMTPADLPAASVLFDTTLGEGFWDIDLDAVGSHLLAVSDGVIVGGASAVVSGSLAETPGLAGPVGHLRLVGVHVDARGTGLATRLVSSVEDGCRALGACAFVTFAWVHAGDDRGALSGVLQRLGYTCERRIEGFYAGFDGPPCPACRLRPCACAADLYVKRV